jgi:glycosyltransferase involved in cell wall biosynthesis
MTNTTAPPSDGRGGEAPRVLVIGPDLPHLGVAGSILLHRLFKNWPPESLLAAGPPVSANVQRLACQFLPYQPPFFRLETTRAVRLIRLARAFRLIPAGRFVPGNFQPAAVVHIFSSLPYSQAAYLYSRRSGVPLVLIVHDDPEEFNGSYAWASSLIRQQVRRIYRHATSRLCVSPELERTLRERYGAAGNVMYPNRSEAIFPRPPQASLSLKEPDRLTLGFAGGLSYGYGPRLLELVPLLRKAGAKVRIYGGNLPVAECSDVLLNQGRLGTPEEAWARIKHECDAVLLPYCFPNHGHQNLYRTHFPSKLPEYLALGMPVIIAGPSYAAGVRWGMRNPESCVVLTEQDGEEWINALTQLRHDGALRLRLSQNSVAAGNRDFDPVTIRSFFHKILGDVACAAHVCPAPAGNKEHYSC